MKKFSLIISLLVSLILSACVSSDADSKADAEEKDAFVILHVEDEVLLNLRSDNSSIPYPNHWSLFGGTAKPSELPREAAVREIREELNIDLEKTRLLKVGEFRYEAGKVNHLFSYRLEKELAEATLNEGQRFGLFRRSNVQDGKIDNLKIIPSHLRMIEVFWD